MDLEEAIHNTGQSFVYAHANESVPFLEQDERDPDDYKRPLFFSDISPAGFSAVDINAYLHPPEGSGIPGPKKFGTLSLLSVSSHRDKFPVSSLARVGPRGYTFGHRTIAGTLTFNTIHRDVFENILHTTSARWKTDLHPDELPPFDIQIVMCNDAGEMSVSSLIGVTLLDSGTIYSLEQVTLSETYSYMALDRTAFRPIETSYRRARVDYNRQSGGDPSIPQQLFPPAPNFQ